VARPILQIIMAGMVLAGCGYHVPGETDHPVALASDGGVRARGMPRVVVDGEGATAHPLLARMLRDALVDRLRPTVASRSHTAADTEEVPPVTVRVLLRLPDRTVQVQEKRRGTNQYRITLRARPLLMVHGTPQQPELPEVTGWATYYGMRVPTSSQASQAQAEVEAMHRLADSLAALLDMVP
jgi:hypothetical protein